MTGWTVGRWQRVTEEPCPACAVWVGTHFHNLLDDGTFGKVVISRGHVFDRLMEITG